MATEAKLGHGWVKLFGEEEFHVMTQEEDVRKDVLPPEEVESSAPKAPSAHRYSHAPYLPYTMAACGASVLSPTFADGARERLQLLLAT